MTLREFIVERCMLPLAVSGTVILRQSDENPRGRAILGFSSQLTMHCSVLHSGPTAEPIEMSFEMMSEFGSRTVCYVGMTIPEGERSIFGKTSTRQA